MLDALLGAGQDIGEEFAPLRPRPAGGMSSWPSGLALGDLGNIVREARSERRLLQGLREPLESEPSQRQQVSWPENLPERSRNEARLGIDVYLQRGRKAVDQLAKTEEHVLRGRQFLEEAQWLAKNRSQFAGRWIALQGGRLLAVGDTAREVFLKVADEKTPPLVIRLENDDLPFAGW